MYICLFLQETLYLSSGLVECIFVCFFRTLYSFQGRWNAYLFVSSGRCILFRVGGTHICLFLQDVVFFSGSVERIFVCFFRTLYSFQGRWNAYLFVSSGRCILFRVGGTHICLFLQDVVFFSGSVERIFVCFFRTLYFLQGRLNVYLFVPSGDVVFIVRIRYTISESVECIFLLRSASSLPSSGSSECIFSKLST